MVEGFFDEEADDPVAVEDEVCAVGLDIADLAVRRSLLVLLFGDSRYCVDEWFSASVASRDFHDNKGEYEISKLF